GRASCVISAPGRTRDTCILESRMTFAAGKNGLHSPGTGFPASRGAAGFSITEVMVVSLIILMITGGSYLSLQPALKSQHVTTAYNQTLMTMRRARDQAAADMRVYVITFTQPGTVTVTQNSPNGPILLTTVLPQDVTFHLEPGLPNSPTVA